MKIYKEDIIANVAAETGRPKHTVETVMDALFGFIRDAVADGNTVYISRFGKFDCRYLEARTNNYGAIPAHYRPYFKASAMLKKAVNAREVKK